MIITERRFLLYKRSGTEYFVSDSVMDHAETRESSGLLAENIKIRQRVWKYLDELQAKGLTKVEEEQKLVKEELLRSA